MKTKKELLEENETLKKIIVDTIWMARRYADGRRTYAVSMVNDALELAFNLGIEIRDDDMLASSKRYAVDGYWLDKNNKNG